jgi:hypothetical protein
MGAGEAEGGDDLMRTIPKWVLRRGVAALDSVLEAEPLWRLKELRELRDELAKGLRTKRGVAGGRARQRQLKASKTSETRSVRDAVFARAKGTCELLDAKGGRCTLMATDLVHCFGRGKGRLQQSERTCIAGCKSCHRVDLTLNRPGGAEVWMRVGATLEGLGFRFEASEAYRRAEFCRTRAALPAAPRLRP